jgi:hypothetical protein
VLHGEHGCVLCICVAVCGVETWTVRKVDQNSWKVLKCGTGEGWRSVAQNK